MIYLTQRRKGNHSQLPHEVGEDPAFVRGRKNAGVASYLTKLVKTPLSFAGGRMPASRPAFWHFIT